MQRHQVGKHSFQIEGNVIYIKYVAAVTLDDMIQMDAITRPVVDALPMIYLVYDLTESGLMTPQARRYAAENSKDLRCAALVIYGTSLLVRAGIALVLSAVRLIAKNVPPTVYVRDEEEARQWIAAHPLADT
jgi:hypothetical protein